MPKASEPQPQPQHQTQTDPRVYYRVETELAVRCRRATRGDVAAFEQRGAHAGESRLEESFPGLAARIACLERKLDQVLAHLDPEAPPPLDLRRTQPVVVSGGGMLLDHPVGELEAGDDVVLEMLLPGEPPRPVDSIAEVVGWRTDPGGRRRVAVRYRLIDESDRDAIVRLVYRVQLAEQRGDRGGFA